MDKDGSKITEGKKEDARRALAEIIEHLKENRYPNKTEWARRGKASHYAARKHGLLNHPDLWRFFPGSRAPRGYWEDLDRVIESAKGFATIVDWNRAFPTACEKARKNGWMDILRKKGMLPKSKWYKPRGYWTLDAIVAEAEKYDTRKKWQAGCPSSYTAARNGGLLKHPRIMRMFPLLRKPRGYWTLDNICAHLEESRYPRKHAWRIGSPISYFTACRRGWLLHPRVCAFFPPSAKRGAKDSEKTGKETRP